MLKEFKGCSGSHRVLSPVLKETWVIASYGLRIAYFEAFCVFLGAISLTLCCIFLFLALLPSN
jgi:hypothetical protein